MRDGDDGRDGVLEGALLGVRLCEGIDAGKGRDDAPCAEKCEQAWEVVADIVRGLVMLSASCTRDRADAARCGAAA